MYDITILIVEDDKILANEFKEYLNKYGYQVNLIENFSKVLNECILIRFWVVKKEFGMNLLL